MRAWLVHLGWIFCLGLYGCGSVPPATRVGALLEELTWQQAAPLLHADTLVVLPIGAAAKEHGPHLLLKNDFLLAEYLKQRLAAERKVVVAPTVSYHYYPAFVEYPGSTTLRLETARNLIVDICRSLSRHGPRRFYALNTGISTVRALQLAQAMLARDGILLHYTDLLKTLSPIEKRVGQQAGGTHADESETSMLLYIAPRSVDMRKAVRDYHPKRPGPFTRNPDGPGTYSPTGTWGDPTLATREKGEQLVEGLVRALHKDLTALKQAPLPAVPAQEEDGGASQGAPNTEGKTDGEKER
jgi:creatinine amidohydrolase